ncbi:hypothetical protein FSARC_12977 [Fusarium sarcochroum]|uniref:Uncharacterized protein n=1 Tax=Fusarium sarcochroum TaxID=1208366 RepID=A0A8H4T4N1_9HYPO|nr:hypothetical protein FSARC_12977 [Fusarium sarcochroum]
MANKRLSRSPESLALLRTIWPELCVDGSNFQKHYSHILEYFDNELNIIRDNGDFYAVQSAHSICTLIQEMKTLDVITRRQILSTARERIPRLPVADDKLLRSIDVAIRLWLTIDISSSNFGRDNILSWRSDQTLQDLIHSHFKDKRRTKYPRTENRINPHLTAEFLNSNFGYTITWTHSLADHLAIDWKYKVITIYEHKICLYNHMRFPGSSIVPQDVIEEAVDTMNLLFPFQDDATKRFLSKKENNSMDLDTATDPGN